MKRRYNHESGVSETVGFIIIFGIVMTGIGLVTLYGYPMLLQQQAEANVKNMQKTMIVLQTDINSLTFKNVPYQETAIQVAGGTLSVTRDQNEVPNFTVSNSTYEFINEFRPGKLRFIADDGSTIIALENGAVITRYPGIEGSYMNAEPRWYYDETTNTFVITLIRIVGDQNFGQTGIGTFSIQLSESEPPDEKRYPISDDVFVTYNKDVENDDFSRAWGTYFQKPELYMSNSGSSILALKYKIKPSVQYLVIKTVNMTVLSL